MPSAGPRLLEGLPGGMFSAGSRCCLLLEILLLLRLFLEASTQGHVEQPMYAVSGSNVNLQVYNLPENHKKLTWFYTTNQKIVEWESSKPAPHYFNSVIKTRLTLDLQNGALHIRNVLKADSSTYLLKVLMENGTEKEWEIPLKVFDPVPKPVIRAEKLQEGNSSCHLVLSCVASGQSLNYTWYENAGPIAEQPREGVLEVTVGPQDHSTSYTCRVSNPVSNDTDTVYITPACELARSSGVAWIATWLAVMVPTVLGLLLT